MGQFIDRHPGMPVHAPDESWQPTMNLGFIEREGKKILHQQWQSNIGRVVWKAVPEIDPTKDPY